MHRILNPIDNLLNSITMYRLVLYGLIFLSILAIVLGFAGIVSFSGTSLLISLLILLVVCSISNYLFSKLFKAPTNQESFLITALILFLIMLPPGSAFEMGIVAASGLIAIASKFVIALNRKHLFNPVAFSAVVLGIVGYGYAVWWIGNPTMFWPTLIVGLLIVRKIRKFTLFFVFLASTLLTQITFGLINGNAVSDIIKVAFLSGPMIFFGTVMLTEPQTMPPKLRLQMIYGLIVGVLSGAHYRIGPFTSTPELGLVIGNLFSYSFSFRERLILSLVTKTQTAKDTYEFVFSAIKKPIYQAGQYMEWTLPGTKLDSRGNRRYFTIASSPTENDFRIGVKIYQNPSSFKQNLVSLLPGDKIIAGNLAGDFTLPKDPNKKLVFIAGGIGVTPFRSIIKSLLDKKEKRSIVLFYTNKTEEEISYRDIFEKAEKELGLNLVYILTEVEKPPNGFKGEVGRMTTDIIKKHVEDIAGSQYFISGPNKMVDAYKILLKGMGVKPTSITTDYFPGF